MRITIYFLGLALIMACSTQKDTKAEATSSESKPKHQRPSAFQKGKFFEVNGTSMLYGGKDSSQHFDVSDCALKPEQFHYGIGRERFPALLEPAFISVEKADIKWHDTTRFLVAYAGDEVKAYSVEDLTHHEIVNDVLNGKPIMAAYCILADLGAIYERQYGDHVLTFALSGYTYYDDAVWDGLDGFVLWDRETESLWWPLIGKSVSGPLKGVKLLEMDKAYWKDTNWGEIKATYPQAQVLISGQDYERPTTWQKLEDVAAIKAEFNID